MVESLVGKINGLDAVLIPQNEERTRWAIDIPSVPSGVYVVEFKAVDYAGNVGYFAKYIITVDLSALSVKIEPYPYEGEISCGSYCGISTTSGYEIESIIVESGPTAAIEGEAYECEI